MIGNDRLHLDVCKIITPSDPMRKNDPFAMI